MQAMKAHGMEDFGTYKIKAFTGLLCTNKLDLDSDLPLGSRFTNDE